SSRTSSPPSLPASLRPSSSPSCDTSFSYRYGPDRFHWFGGFHVVVRRGLDSLLHAPPLQPHGIRRGPLCIRTPRRWRLNEMTRFLASGPSPLWWQPRAASPYKVL